MKKLCIFVLFFAVGFLSIGCDIDPPPGTKFKVIYFDNGCTSGFPPADNNKYTSGMEAIVLDKGTLVKTGYTFQGWNTNAQGSGASYISGDKITLDDRNIFLYAVWVRIK